MWPKDSILLSTVTITLLMATRPSRISAQSTRRNGSMQTQEDASEGASKTNASSASTARDFCSISHSVESERLWETVRKARVSAQSRPCCTSWGYGRVDCFIRGPKSNVMHISIDKGVYSEWEDLGGVIVDEIECVSRDVGIIDVLVLGTNIALWVKTFSDGKWSDWESSDGKLLEVPCCVARTSKTVNCVYRGTNNKGYHIEAVNGTWGEHEDLGANLLFGPFGCTSLHEDHFTGFASGMNLNLFERYTFFSDGWPDDYSPRNGLVKGRPSVTTWNTDRKTPNTSRMDVFTLGVKTNSVMQRTFDGTWHEWIDLGGVFDSSPECVTTRIGKIHCFAVGEGSYLYSNALNGTTWTGWKRTSYGYFMETPACVVSNCDEITCAARRFNQKVIFITNTVDD